ncbi:complement C1r subcomponent [Pelobates fuscus]|uniref:complement C1r subcomponent n=1 Tax=Pelobates fuscus TaxID=191477 RepID=UPI002FE455C1
MMALLSCRYRWVFLLFGFATCSTNRKPLYGIITSPNYPKPYPNNNKTTWDIAVPDGYKISLNFLTFVIEPSENCHYDYVKVFDDKRELGTFCGRPQFRSHPGQHHFLSQRNQMRIEFKSDFSNDENDSDDPYSGFQAYYRAIDRNECSQSDDNSVTWTSPCEHHCHNFMGGYFCSCMRGYKLQSDQKSCKVECSNELYTEESGFISSPGYPKPYPGDLHCNYSIRLEKGLVISLKFDDIFEIDYHPRVHCPYDTLKILADEKLVDNYCGRRSPGTVKTGSNSINIVFETDDSGDSKGWKLWYSAEPIQCPNPVPLDSFTIITPKQNEYRMRDYIVVSCQTGYKLMESHVEHRGYTMLCQRDGTWHQPMPQCEIVSCKEPEILQNGQLVFLTSPNKWTYLSVFEYSCDAPFYSMLTATGSAKFTCSAQRKWTDENGGDQPPRCIPVCGKQWVPPDKPYSRIIGGDSAKIGNFPWQVLLNRHGRSGGAVIGEHWVLTAAHVLWDKTASSSSNILNKEPSSINLFLGGVSVDEQIKQGSYAIADYHFHPDYNPENFDNDIALIRLEYPLVMNLNVSPICLPEKNDFSLYEDNRKGYASGYGDTGKNKIADTLQYVTLPVGRRTSCHDFLKKKKKEVMKIDQSKEILFSENMFCAGYQESGMGDSCQGDSGGAYVTDRNETWVATGLVSWGISCSRGYGFYTKVINYVDWILGYTGRLAV